MGNGRGVVQEPGMHTGNVTRKQEGIGISSVAKFPRRIAV